MPAKGCSGDQSILQYGKLEQIHANIFYEEPTFTQVSQVVRINLIMQFSGQCSSIFSGLAYWISDCTICRLEEFCIRTYDVSNKRNKGLQPTYVILPGAMLVNWNSMRPPHNKLQVGHGVFEWFQLFFLICSIQDSM